MQTFFISSTFKDMQAERDVLHKQIFPQLRKLTKEYGEDIQEVDLRWGVDTANMTEAESGQEVLRVCVDAIDRCKPYIVVLLGERYGWIPSKSTVDSVRDERISDRYEQMMSITELEIKYGALLNDDNFDHCIFCFRNADVIDKIDDEYKEHYCSESSIHASRLEALKQKIREKKDAIILEYSAEWDAQKHELCGLEDFSKQLYQKLKTMLERDFEGQQPQSAAQQHIKEVELIKKTFLNTYVRRYPEEFWIAKHIYEFVHHVDLSWGHSSTQCLLVSGDAGSGKSALMAYAAEHTPELENRSILCFAAASGCKDVDSLKRYVAYCIEDILSQPHNEDYTSIDQHLRDLNQKAKSRGIVCFVDGLDQIYYGHKEPYIDLPALCPDMFWVFSALKDFPFEKAAVDYKYETVNVGSLILKQRSKLISQTAGNRGKKLDDELTKMITEVQGADNPLFLSLVLQRLFMMNKDEFEAAQALAPGMEGLHRYMQGLIDKMPRVPDRMAVYILEETAKLFDQKDFSEILMLIAKSRNGLTEKELEELLELEGIGFSPVKFQQIMSYLYDAFSQRSNGKWTFNHRLYTQAVCELMSDDDTKRIEGLFTEYALKNEDFLICEGFYHLLAQKHPAFAQVLEKCNRWDTKSEVRSLVGTSAKDNIEVREFLTELCLTHPTDELADFWLDFDERGYGEDVCEMLKEIITNLLLTSVSDSRKWQLAVRSTYYMPKENHLAILSDARSYAQSLEKTERYIADASIEAEVFYSLSILRAPYDEITQALKNSTESIEKAFASLNKKGSYKQYDALFKSLYTVNDVATYRRISDADKMWLRALELLESVEHLESENEDDYVYYKVVFLSQLCDIYCSKPWLDYDESKRFGDKALELCELAVSKRPTMRNLRNKFDTLTSYVRRLKAEYSCSYRSQIVDCARQIYAMEKSNHNKRQLAVALGEYGLAYIKAVNSGVLKYDSDKIREAVKLLDKSAELFEELLSLDYTRGQLMVYATITVDRVELLCDNPDKALKYAHRSLDLLLQRMSQINEEAKSAQESELDFYQRQLMWCEGWIGRAKSAMATIYMEQLDLENSLLYAKEGLELNRKNTRNSLVYCRQMLNCALVLAQSLYYLRADEEALLACDEATAILDELGSQGESREPFEAELMYIRGRIAFEHEDIVTAWEKCRECLNRKKTKLLYNKALILKADCLQAMGDSESDAAWKEALKVWREELSKENKEFSRVAQYIKSMREPKPDVKVKWRTYNSYKLPAFYMAYCYHHYVNNENRMNEDYDSFERKVLFALYFYGKGYLKDRIPYGLNKKELPEHSTAKLSVCSDIGEFAQIMSEIISLERFVAKDVSELIFENIDRFSDVELNEQEFEMLLTVAKNTYYKLTEERRSLYHHKQGHDLLQEVFGLDDTYPVHKIEVDFKGDVYSEWPSDCVESTSKCWYALFKLLIFLFAHNPDKSRKLGGIFRSVYMVVSEQSGGSDVVSEADLSFLTQNEIQRLIEFYDGETELSMSKANKKWFSFKNRWYTELYIATKDKKLVDTRLKELKSYLEEPYSSMYYETNEKAIDSDIVNAIIDLIKTLNSRGAGEQAIGVVRFAESSDVLSNRLNSNTLFSVQTLSEEDREWLEEVKYKYCQMWLDNNKGGLFSIQIS